MDKQEWQEFLEYLDTAEISLHEAAFLMDGIEGFTAGGEHAISAALSAIASVRASELEYRNRNLTSASQDESDSIKPYEGEWKSTWLQGYVDDGVTYGDLVKVFGEPHDDGDGYKVDAEWRLDVDGELTTIYNYKTGKNYDDDGDDVEDITVWHIGGAVPEVVDAINAHIKEKLMNA